MVIFVVIDCVISPSRYQYVTMGSGVFQGVQRHNYSIPGDWG